MKERTVRPGAATILGDIVTAMVIDTFLSILFLARLYGPGNVSLNQDPDQTSVPNEPCLSTLSAKCNKNRKITENLSSEQMEIILKSSRYLPVIYCAARS